VDDCNKFKPHATKEYGQVEISFAWISCTDGACVDVECADDSDCDDNQNSDRAGVTCVQNQCAPDLSRSGVECDQFRDKEVDGRCIRQPEIPDPDCKGSLCDCFSDGDCRPWESCRQGNMCTPFQSTAYSNASGRACESDDDCGAYYLEQDMIAAGLNPNLMNMWSFCTLAICENDPENAYTRCGDGFACIEVTNVEPDPYGYSPQRTVCVPDKCSKDSGCDPSYSECTFDKDCPGDEVCTWPWGYCRGVCLDVKCANCAEWLSSHRTRACISHETKVWLDGGTAEEPEVPISVRRPD